MKITDAKKTVRSAIIKNKPPEYYFSQSEPEPIDLAKVREFIEGAGEVSKNGKIYNIILPFKGKLGLREKRAQGIAQQIRECYGLQEVYASNGSISVVNPKGELKKILDNTLLHYR